MERKNGNSLKWKHRVDWYINIEDPKISPLNLSNSPTGLFKWRYIEIPENTI